MPARVDPLKCVTVSHPVPIPEKINYACLSSMISSPPLPFLKTSYNRPGSTIYRQDIKLYRVGAENPNAPRFRSIVHGFIAGHYCYLRPTSIGAVQWPGVTS
jgi:hypothetical protein